MKAIKTNKTFDREQFEIDLRKLMVKHGVGSMQAWPARKDVAIYSPDGEGLASFVNLDVTFDGEAIVEYD